MWAWPRDMWLGRTYAETESSYPTSGDTFRVQLLSAHFTGSEGTQAVTEHERGTVVTARTWPEAYLPYGTDVIVKRIRGIGPNGSGEWWIEPTGDSSTPPLLSYGGGYVFGESGVLGSMTSGVVTLPGLQGWAFPNGTDNDYFSWSAGASRDAAWLTCLQSGRYLIVTNVRWILHSIPAVTWRDMHLSYWTAPSLTVYPLSCQYGTTMMTLASDVSISATFPINNSTVRDCYGSSSAQLRPSNSGSGEEYRVSHTAANHLLLVEGDELRAYVRAVSDYIAAPYTIGSPQLGQVDLESFDVAIIPLGEP